MSQKKTDIQDFFTDDFEVTYDEDLYENKTLKTNTYDKNSYDDHLKDHVYGDDIYEDDVYEDDLYDDDLYEEDTYDDPRRNRRKSNNIRQNAPGKTRARKSGVPLAAPIRKGGLVLSRIAHFLISSLTVALIIAMTVYVTWTFWRASTPYGDIMEAVKAKTISERLAAYLCVAACFIVFELISLLWSMSRVSVRDEHGRHREDTGRGLTSFVLVFISSYAAFLFSGLIPEIDEIFFGVKAGLDVYGSMHNVLFGFCAAGVISCILRKY